MKSLQRIPDLTAMVMITLLMAVGCSDSPPKDDAAKTTAADLFRDDRPAYDPNVIDPGAEIVEIAINATGVSMTDMSYVPDKISVRANCTIKLKIKNLSTDESMPHNWVLVHDGTMEIVANAGLNVGKEGDYVPNINDVLIACKLLGPQEETEIIFAAPPPGKYQFVCTYPGHWSLMNGEFIVE